jgi:cyanate permease
VLDVRRLLQTVGMVVPALCLAACALAPSIVEAVSSGAGVVGAWSPLPALSPEAAVALITLGGGASALTCGAVSCNQFDLSPRNAGTIFGLANTAACLAALLAVPLSGALFDITHSFDAVFLLFAGHYLVGAAVYYQCASDQPLSIQLAPAQDSQGPQES